MPVSPHIDCLLVKHSILLLTTSTSVPDKQPWFSCEVIPEQQIATPPKNMFPCPPNVLCCHNNTVYVTCDMKMIMKYCHVYDVYNIRKLKASML